ncbi:MAG: hypothetical protein K2F79_08875, partial [Muribaculaceae bacterium]|nr:hypothetical protein [Muribaculaceae bacterium]
HVVPVRLDNIPAEALPAGGDAGFRSALGMQADSLKRQVYPITRGSGLHYVSLDALRSIIDEQHKLSLEAYATGRK